MVAYYAGGKSGEACVFGGADQLAVSWFVGNVVLLSDFRFAPVSDVNTSKIAHSSQNWCFCNVYSDEKPYLGTSASVIGAELTI